MAVLLSAAVSANVGCKKQEQKAAKERVVNVRVWTAESRSLRPFVESVGTLKPYEEVVVSSELDGILKTIYVDEGSPVTRSQLIAEIKETDYRLAVEQAAAALKQTEAALANVKLEHQRKEALYREELVTKQQFDDIVARLALTQGDVERAKVGLDLAKERLTKTKIFAPMAGSVKEKKVTPGDYIRNGTFLVSIIRTDLLKLAFSVPEKDVGSLREGQDIVFTVDSFPGREFRGKVKTLYPILEEKTRSLLVEAQVV
ncbi:MAG: efflux RND transporter periplasmic adaptor subunit, partial [Syntrophales bacterium]|nr:efflux RND transporter periplasmic adaptor subunit [Syntrophales bacterium]